MTPRPEDIARLRDAGRRARRVLSAADLRRRELAPYVDTGMLSDADVKILHDAFISGLREPLPDESR